MPSFDVVSEANQVEVKNAVDQANKEITTRFDFKGSDAKGIELAQRIVAAQVRHRAGGGWHRRAIIPARPRPPAPAGAPRLVKMIRLKFAPSHQFRR